MQQMAPDPQVTGPTTTQVAVVRQEPPAATHAATAEGVVASVSAEGDPSSAPSTSLSGAAAL
jgi:hypothetical protein